MSQIASESLTGLDDILAPLPQAVRGLTATLVDLVGAHPGLSAKVMPGWRSVNFTHAKAGYICALLPQTERVSIYFQHGRLLSDPDGLLEGEAGKKGRTLRLYPGQPVPKAEIGFFVAEAIALFA